MRRLLILILSSILIKVHAQTYVPMPMQNCYWQMTHSRFCSQSTGTPAISSSLLEYKVYPNSDTLIGTKKYVKFYSQIITNTVSTYCTLSSGVAAGYWGAVRQDTSGKKIYLIFPSQTNENLLYNFNYVKGDTVKTILGYYSSPPPGNIPYRIIDSIFYQSYSDGICRKTFRQKNYQYNGGSYIWTQHAFFTEGIGNEVGINERNYQITTSGTGFSTQENWNSFLTINNFTISSVSTNTCSQTVGINSHQEIKGFTLYPNPSTGELFIKGFFDARSIHVYNTLGSEIKFTPFSFEEGLGMRLEYPPGIYFVRIGNFTEKIIKE